MDGNSLDIKQEKLNQLKQIFPEVFMENQIDWEKLKATLGKDINFEDERYVLNWAGKSNAFRVLQAPTTATLAPAREESFNFDQTQHVFIEGENLEVLKVLQKAYYGKIKMIYIDPPYNTGNDHFIYPDKFSETKEEYLKRIGDKDELGYLTSEGLFRKNSKDSGHYHSNWLSMIYPRLFLARNLLRDDGVIFVSIDDNEVHNLRLLMNEIFGEENFIANIVWEKKYTRSNDARWFSDNHDHILVFGKSKENVKFNLQSRSKEQLKAYSNPDNHPKGPWKSTPLHAKSGTISGFTYTFKNSTTWSPPPGTYPRFSKETLKRYDENNEIWFGEDGKSIPSRKTFLSEVKEGVTPITIWKYNEVGHNHEANDELKNLKLSGIFNNPKPTRLLRRMIELSSNKLEKHIVLDFFSGSATSAHAVLELNKEEKSNRKFIMVQLPEKTDENSEAFKAGYKTIAEIGKERIRRVIKKIEEEQEKNHNLFSSEKTKLNLGFKVFKLHPSNFKIWWSDQLDTEAEIAEQLDAFVDPTLEKVNEENMLYELLLKSGFDLNSKIVNKGDFYLINDNDMALALAKIDEEIVRKIIALRARKVIALDKLFVNNDQLKTNTALQMKDAGIDFRTI